MYAIKNGTLYPFSVQEVGRYIPDTPLLYERGNGRSKETRPVTRKFYESACRPHIIAAILVLLAF